MLNVKSLVELLRRLGIIQGLIAIMGLVAFIIQVFMYLIAVMQRLLRMSHRERIMSDYTQDDYEAIESLVGKKISFDYTHPFIELAEGVSYE